STNPGASPGPSAASPSPSPVTAATRCRARPFTPRLPPRLRVAGQAEDPLADHVEVHLGRPAADAHGAGRQQVAGPAAPQLVLPAAGQGALLAEEREPELGDLLAVLHRHQLADVRGRARVGARQLLQRGAQSEEVEGVLVAGEAADP